VFYSIRIIIMKNKNDVLRLMVLLSFADKEFHENEEEMIKKLSLKHDLPSEKIDLIFEDIKNSDENFVDMCLETLEKIQDEDTRKTTLTMLAQLSMADFILHEDEIITLELIADKWGMLVSSLRSYK
ncbi:TerB family tellurite resistance protein, partial [Alphaproteobacteria bacterium]|nr:TerB family tellurite resistance protein [Alphaproteobacteria bacterium]